MARSSNCCPGTGLAAAVTFAGTDLPGIYTVSPAPRARRHGRSVGECPGGHSRSERRGRRGSVGRTVGAVVSPVPPPVDPNAPVRFAVDLFDVDESTIAPGSATTIEALGVAPSASAVRGSGGAETRPAARDELWIPLRPARPARPVGRVGGLPPRRGHPHPAWLRDPDRARRGGRRHLMGFAFDAPLALLLLVPALGLTIALHLASPPAQCPPTEGRPGPACLRARGTRLRARRVPAGSAGRSAGDGVRRRPLEFGGQRRAGGRPGLPSRDAGRERDGDVAGIVAFGREALVERLPSELEELDRIASTPVRSAPDIGAALRLATAPSPTIRRSGAMLLSDGNDTAGGGQADFLFPVLYLI